MDMYVIPTHRKCFDAINSAYEEIKYLRKLNAVDITLVLLDNSKQDIFESNERYLRKLKSEIPTYHVSLNDMNKIIYEVSKKVSINYEQLKEMLLPDKTDYGKIYNFIYIIATILKVDRFYRRDSDCSNKLLDKRRYPIIIENEYLGKNVNNILNKSIQEEHIKYTENEKVCIVGSGYEGNWDLDMEEIVLKNPNAMKELMKICSIDEEIIDEQYNLKYIQEEKEATGLPIISTIFEPSHAIECGNMGMSEVYQYLCNFIGEYGIGFDYHVGFISSLCKVPIIYHKNKNTHIHDENRRKDINLFNYWKGILKMVDFDNYHYEFIKGNYTNIICKENNRLEAIKSSCNKLLPDLLEEILDKYDREKRINIFNEIIEKVLEPTDIEIYKEIAKYLDNIKYDLIDELNYDYKLSIQLQRNWPTIISALNDIDNNVIYEILTSVKQGDNIWRE